MNGFISVREMATRWDITPRQVQKFCAAGKIEGVTRFANTWAIPEDAVKPTRTGILKPGRKKKTNNKQMIDEISEHK